MVRVPQWLRDSLAVLAIALVATALILAPPLDRFHGVSIDVLTWLRWRFYERSHPAPESRTVVVALDEETYDGAQFPRWRRCDSDLLVGRSLRLHRERRSRILPPALQWQGRAHRHAARCRGSPGHLEAVCHDAGKPG